MDLNGRKITSVIGILSKSLRGEGFMRNPDMMLFLGITAFPVSFYSLKTVLPKGSPGSFADFLDSEFVYHFWVGCYSRRHLIKTKEVKRLLLSQSVLGVLTLWGLSLVKIIANVIYGANPDVLWRQWCERFLGPSTVQSLQTEPQKGQDKSSWEIASEHMGYNFYRQVVSKNTNIFFNVGYEQLGFVKPKKRQFTLQVTTTRLLAAYCSTFVDCLTNAFFIFLRHEFLPTPGMRFVNAFVLLVRLSMGYLLAAKTTQSLNFLTTKFFSLVYYPQPVLANQATVQVVQPLPNPPLSLIDGDTTKPILE